MLRKFFQAMYENPTKDDWTEQVMKDLSDLNIKADLQALEGMAKSTFKNLVKCKGMEFALDQLNTEKFKHSKMENLVYTDLKVQDYLLSTEITTEQKRNLFLFRTRMANFSENFRNGDMAQPCKMCHLFRDSQSHGVDCYETMKYVKIKGNLQEIYTNNISRETGIMITQIMEARKNKLG